MNFFEAQDKAHKRTGMLLWALGIGLIGMTAGLYFITMLAVAPCPKSARRHTSILRHPKQPCISPRSGVLPLIIWADWIFCCRKRHRIDGRGNAFQLTVKQNKRWLQTSHSVVRDGNSDRRTSRIESSNPSSNYSVD